MIELDFSDKRSISEQIVGRVIELAGKGVFPAGSPLPSVRSMATELSVNPNTVQKAYAELERLGVIVSVRGRGSLIASNSDPLRQLHVERIEHSLSEAAGDAKVIGIGAEQLCERLRQIFNGEEGSL